MPLSVTNPLSHLGQDFSWFPPENARGQMNIVSGTHAICSRILTLLLIRKGEYPHHPTLGIGPELFEPLSYKLPHYFVTNIREEIIAWFEETGGGLDTLEVNVNQQDIYTNEIKIYITFTPTGARGHESVLTFGYWEWTGFIHDRDLETFKRGVSLNGQPFFGLT